MLGAKTLFIDERTSVVVMRDTPDAVRMAEKLVASIDVPEPEVLIEVEVLEIARSKLLNLALLRPDPSRPAPPRLPRARPPAQRAGPRISFCPT